MTFSVAEVPPGRGVIVAELDLTFVRDVIDRARIGSAGYAYAVDEFGGSSPIRTSTSSFGIRTSRRFRRCELHCAGAATDPDGGTVGKDPDGTEVLSAFQIVKPLDWRVFVEEPSSEAFAPLESAIWRTALLLLAFLLIAITTSVLLARRLVRPIQSIQSAAAKIGSGALNQRIDVPSRDELGVLAEEFNQMAERLQDSYTSLEQKVQDRTQELGLALAELDAKSRELEAASRHKSEFLANMSHELRTPLNAIIGFSQLLRDELFGELNDKQQEYLDDILAGGEHLLALINDILDLSKVEAGEIELDITPFSL